MNKLTGYLLLVAVMATTVALGGCSKSPQPVATVPPVSAVAGNVSDIEVTQHVYIALQQSESLKGFDISVDTVKGDVRLKGTVDTQAQIEEAVSLARAADGAHTIHGELTIKR